MQKLSWRVVVLVAVFVCILAFILARIFGILSPASATGTLLPVSDSVTTNTIVVYAAASPNNNHDRAGLGDRITVYVHRLDSLFKLQKANNKKIVLFLDKREIAGIYPEVLDTATDVLKFHLEQLIDNRENMEAWADLLGNPPLRVWNLPMHILRQVTVSVGFEGEQDMATLINKKTNHPGQNYFNLTIVDDWDLYFAVGFLLFVLISLLYFAFNTNLLRSMQFAGDTVQPYSLALSQMAFWFFIVLSMYIFLFMITGTTIPLSNSSLTILGISTFTGLAGTFVTKNQVKSSQEGEADGQTSDGQSGQTGDGQGGTMGQTIAAVQPPSQDVTTTAPVAPVTPATKTRTVVTPKLTGWTFYRNELKTFVTDILSDGNGINFHRFQMAIWTLVFGGIFIIEVYRRLEIPDFDNSLLLLMGISSGTYIGFKFPETKK